MKVEAIVAGWVNAISTEAAATVAGVTHGLVGMAIAWGVVQYATGLWALWRLRLVSLSMKSPDPALAAPVTSVPS
jgi:hypothetical protein